MKTVRRQGGIIQIRDKRITQLTERQTIAFNMWKVVKKKVLKCFPKSEKTLKFCSKVKKVFNNAGNLK